jgi:hypothetical protein
VVGGDWGYDAQPYGELPRSWLVVGDWGYYAQPYGELPRSWLVVGGDWGYDAQPYGELPRSWLVVGDWGYYAQPYGELPRRWPHQATRPLPGRWESLASLDCLDWCVANSTEVSWKGSSRSNDAI